MELSLQSRTKVFGGWMEFYSHPSTSTKSPMRFSVYRPPQSEKSRVPVVYWLSGLTCTEENFMLKAGAQRYAAEMGLMLVVPDTSPRKTGVPDETKSEDLGAGASFYLNATQAPWSAHYKMEDYVIRELPDIIESKFPAAPGRRSVSGHSMGGHGALILALRNPGFYLSVTAMAPLSAPTECAWGQKALGSYLGEDKKAWEAHDAHCLVQKAERRTPFLIDQGEDDKFLKDQLRLDLLEAACAKADYPAEIRRHPGYDHSYYFVASFIGEHLKHHADVLHYGGL